MFFSSCNPLASESLPSLALGAPDDDFQWRPCHHDGPESRLMLTTGSSFPGRTHCLVNRPRFGRAGAAAAKAVTVRNVGVAAPGRQSESRYCSLFSVASAAALRRQSRSESR